MEAISRGAVSLLYFTVQLDDFANLYPKPYRYFLVTQVFTAKGEYICTQLRTQAGFPKIPSGDAGRH